MRIVLLKNWILWVLFFGLPAIQLTTGYALEIFDWIIGIFPSVILYFIWLYQIVANLGKRKNFGLRIGLAVFAFIVLPIYNVLINVIPKDGPSVQFVYLFGAFTLFVWVILMLMSWRAIAKQIYAHQIAKRQYPELINFKQYRIFFWQFVAGPFTFFLIDRKIKAIARQTNSFQ